MIYNIKNNKKIKIYLFSLKYLLLFILIIFLLPAYAEGNDNMLNFEQLYSDKPLGCNVENNKFVFRVFAPRATGVKLLLFDSPFEDGAEYIMSRDNDGVWEFALDRNLYGKYYGYKVDGPKGNREMFNPDIIIADPYSKAVVTKNNYHHEARTVITDTKKVYGFELEEGKTTKRLKEIFSYDWEGDTWLNIPHEDLIIYEMHVKDMTAHPSSDIKNKGSYLSLTELNKTGGLSYLKELGVNAVELLPCQDFGNIEIPYGKKTPEYEFNEWEVNTWNPYERNHWGYMTTYFFAPENYYASTVEKNKYNGMDGQQVNEFKDMVKAFHKQKISVIMDVVYNHVAQYDYNPFKYIDKKYYFRLKPDGSFETKSGCGNDFKTESLMARRMIVDSIKYWMTEYHIDGFRFDLATMIDFETLKLITTEAKKINPDVILIAEPWGGGQYNLGMFSDLGWGAWNDLIRNGVKGYNPYDGRGFIFGRLYGVSDLNNLKAYTMGSLRKHGGPFIKSSQSVNYMESHDDLTLGDFIRIGNADVSENAIIKDINKHVKLNLKQMKLNKLAALFLLTSQGMIMLHEGQEFARSKVIAQTSVSDNRIGQIDHNSYEKDNETNWINYNHKNINIELFNYYKGLIELRKNHKAFRYSSDKSFKFLVSSNKSAFGYLLSGKETKDNDFIVLLNGHHQDYANFFIPKGKWGIIVHNKNATLKSLREINKSVIKVPPISGMVLTKFPL